MTKIACRFTEKTPRLILAEKWNVTIPDWLDDETVAEQNLCVYDEELSETEDRCIIMHLGNCYNFL